LPMSLNWMRGSSSTEAAGCAEAISAASS
jgi:hypothetical protein